MARFDPRRRDWGPAPDELVCAARALPLRDGALRIVAVADTHSSPHPDAAARIAALAPDAILHGGDVGELGVLDALARIAPVIAVRGNIDGATPALPDVVTLGLTERGATRCTLLLVHIALRGVRLRAPVMQLATRARASLVVCGHSHVPIVARDRGVVVFNPGSIGPRRFRLPIVFGVIEVDRTGVRVRHVDCETGQPWHPPRAALAGP